MTTLVGLGAIGLLVLIDPRTLPWLGARLEEGWNAIVAFAAALLGSLRPQR